MQPEPSVAAARINPRDKNFIMQVPQAKASLHMQPTVSCNDDREKCFEVAHCLRSRDQPNLREGQSGSRPVGATNAADISTPVARPPIVESRATGVRVSAPPTLSRPCPRAHS